MKTDILKIDTTSYYLQKIGVVVEVLKRGGVVAIPTETVYGLCVNAKDKKALDRLYRVKKRDKKKPFTIQIATISQVKNYADKIPSRLWAILKQYWPGPLTVIITTKDGTKVGLRMPDNKIALSIIKRSKLPLAVTSANISGKAAVSSADEVASIFGGSIDLIVDDGCNGGGVESTVLDCTASPFKILRKGSISDKIEKILMPDG